MKAKPSANMILLLTVGSVFLLANCGLLIWHFPLLLLILLPCVVITVLLPLLATDAPVGRQLWFLAYGNRCLKIFLLTTCLSILCQMVLAFLVLPGLILPYLVNLLVCVCVLSFVTADGDKIEARGEFHGVLTREPKGENGFGYDPLFYYPPLGKTAAELTADEKNAVSHRANALKVFYKKLKEAGYADK
jgi:hypothetical protein